jgi:hypothetical protein
MSILQIIRKFSNVIEFEIRFLIRVRINKVIRISFFLFYINCKEYYRNIVKYSDLILCSNFYNKISGVL